MTIKENIFNYNLLLADRVENHKKDERIEFQRDRDRIVHSRAFRRLMHKTQIFNANKGDHYRNRLTHTLEVMQIGRSIGRLLNLNEDLIEAIALGHDLGHTPFGHVGERRLHEIMSNGIAGGVPATKQGFKHNFQSVRVVDYIESRCDDYSGINLTLAVREGILKHTKLKYKDKKVVYTPIDFNEENLRVDIDNSITLEGQVVAIADEIAQLTHDIEDGVRGGIIKFDKYMDCELVRTYLEKTSLTVSKNPTYNERHQIIKGMVGFLINHVKDTSLEKINIYYDTKGIPNFGDTSSVFEEKCISFSKDIERQADRLAKNRNNWIISSQLINQADSKSEYFISQIFKAYYNHPMQLPDYILARYYNIRDADNFDRGLVDIKMMQDDPRFLRLICDHIAGMSDQFAAREYINLYQPKYY